MIRHDPFFVGSGPVHDVVCGVYFAAGAWTVFEVQDMTEERNDRLAEIAEEWRHRLRTEEPAANQRWLHANTSPEDREDLLYVLGAAVPDDRPWLSLTAWIVPRPDPRHVDEIAVERACKGEEIPLSRAERDAAIAWCKRRGLTDVATARLLRIAPRTVAEVRRRARPQPVDSRVEEVA